MPDNFNYLSFRITALTAKIRNFYHDLMAGNRSHCICLSNVDVLRKLMIICHHKAKTLAAGISADDNTGTPL